MQNQQHQQHPLHVQVVSPQQPASHMPQQQGSPHPRHSPQMGQCQILPQQMMAQQIPGHRISSLQLHVQQMPQQQISPSHMPSQTQQQQQSLQQIPQQQISQKQVLQGQRVPLAQHSRQNLSPLHFYPQQIQLHQGASQRMPPHQIAPQQIPAPTIVMQKVMSQQNLVQQISPCGPSFQQIHQNSFAPPIGQIQFQQRGPSVHQHMPVQQPVAQPHGAGVLSPIPVLTAKSIAKGQVSSSDAANSFLRERLGDMSNATAARQLVQARRARLRRAPIMRYLQGPSTKQTLAAAKTKDEQTADFSNKSESSSFGMAASAVSSEKDAAYSSFASTENSKANEASSDFPSVSLRGCSRPVDIEAYFALSCAASAARAAPVLLRESETLTSASVAPAAAAKEDSLHWCFQQLQQVIAAHPYEAATAAFYRENKPLLHQTILAHLAAEAKGFGQAASAVSASTGGANATSSSVGNSSATGSSQGSAQGTSQDRIAASLGASAGAISGKECFKDRWIDPDFVPTAPALDQLLVVISCALKCHIAELVAGACAIEKREFEQNDLQIKQRQDACKTSRKRTHGESEGRNQGSPITKRVVEAKHFLAALSGVPPL